MATARERELSYAQRRLWFLAQLMPESTVHSLSTGRRLRGPLHVEALGGALRRVIDRHEVLRTVFPSRDGVPCAVVADGPGVEMEVRDLRGTAERDREDAASRQAAAEATRPFDLSRGPLLRMLLLQLGERDWVLQRTIHHIVADALSVEVLWREVADCYRAEVEGGEAQLPALPLQYADYAAWQRGRLEGEAMARQLAFWTRRLQGAPEAIELPADRPRPRVPSHRAGWRWFQVPDAVADGVLELSRKERVTPYMTLLAVFQALLGRWTGRRDVLVGTPVSGRTRREVECLVGLFANLIVMRVDLGGDPSFATLLARVRTAALDAFANRDVPFERLVDELRLPREIDRTPLVQVLFQVLHGRRLDLELAGVETEVLPGEAWAATPFDLELHLQVEDGGLGGRLVYSRDLFDEGTADRMVGHYQRLLRAIVERPEAPVWSAALLTDGERGALQRWGLPSTSYPREQAVHRLFEERARRSPDRVALVSGEQRVTYGELDRRANRLAHHLLLRRGLGPEDVVAICLDRGVDLVVGMLGVLKAGGTYLPLDPEHPRERLAFVLGDAGCRLVLAHSRLLDRLPPLDVPAICLDGDSAWMREPSTPVAVPTHPDAAAYLIYTSGSTGRPKGVIVGHGALANFLRSMAERPGLGEEDVLLAVTTVAFDIAGLELLLPLVTGGRVVVADRETAKDAARLMEVLEEQRVSAMQATPVTWQMLLEAGWRGAPGLAALCGGEALREELARGLLERGVKLWNLYGPTETTVWSSVERVEDWRRISLGRPIASTRMTILDRWMQPVPTGVPGELHVGGEGLARGYHLRPGLTAERFVPDPEGEGGRLYRTGDLVRFHPSGRVEYLGRVDEQVKVRGFRVEPGEVEARLLEHPQVREAVVVQRGAGAWEQRLVAYVTCEAMPGVRELRAHLRARLPEHMVPAQFVELEALPRTPNGKVDRRRLPQPEAVRPGLGEIAEPRTESQKRIAAIWQELLNVPRVGVEDDFFELGGDSMLVVRLVARLQSELGVTIGVRTVFERRTVAGLAGLGAAASAGLG